MGRVLLGIARDPSRINELSAWFADDYVFQDRRRLTGMPDLDRVDFVEMARFDHELDEEMDVEFVAVRGQRMSLARVVNRYADGSINEFLALVRWNSDVNRLELTIRFDLDDLDAAVAELDRLHAEINAEDPSPPTR